MKVQSVTDLCLCVWTHVHIQKRHQIRTWNTSELDVTQFVLRRWRSESCTEYWLWRVGLCVGADRTADVSTRRLGREWSFPWHVWSDVRTSVKWSVWRMGGVQRVLVETYYSTLSLDYRLHVLGDEGRIRDGFVSVCLDTSSTVRIQQRHQIRTWNISELDVTQFAEYWLWCVAICVSMRTVRLTSPLDV